MATVKAASCKDCKYYLKVTHEYCYHPSKFGTALENASRVPDWCPLKRSS